MSQLPSEPSLLAVGTAEDVGDLYRSLSARLENIVRRDVQAPDAVIEDACQLAWSGLVRHCARVRRNTALAWLTRTAEREAFRLVRREGRELSLDATLEQGGEGTVSGGASGLAELAEQHARLDAISELPGRQQRLVWLQGLGFSYDEMAAQTGASHRTVERQLLRAKQRLRGLEEQAR